MLFRVVSKMPAGLRGLAGLIALAFGGCSGCDDGGFPIDAPIPDATQRGTVSLAWSLTDLVGQPISCEDVGASFVSLELRSKSSLSGSVASFACGNSPSMSSPIDVGTYDVAFELHGTSLTAVPAPGQNGVVIGPNQDTRLTSVTFIVDTSGRLVLGLTALGRTSNCNPVSLGGAGITGTTITLKRGDGGCAPVTFIRTRGTTPLGSYMIRCSPPLPTTCIENDETLTVTSMLSGPYTIHVGGSTGSPIDCWVNDDSFTVPAQGKARIDTLNLVFQSGTPGC